MRVTVTHEMLALLLPLMAVVIVAGFAFMIYMARDLGRMVKAVAGLVYQEAEKTRATLAPRDR